MYELQELSDMYFDSIKQYLREVDKPNGVMANYFKGMTNKLGSDAKRSDIVEESYNYAWDLSSWLDYPYPYKLFMVYDFYIKYFELSKSDRIIVRRGY